MIQKRIYIITLVFLTLGCLSSCNKWLDLKPQDGIVGSEFWQTKEDVQAAVIGCYSSLLVNQGRPLTDNLFMYGEFRADMVSPGPVASTEELDIMNVNILSSNSLTDWTTFYRIINYCNNVIDYAPGVMETDPTFKQDELDGYMAEALTLRAYMYFVLARTWGNVPLKLTATKSDADNFQIPVSMQIDVLKQVEKDLLEAERKAKITYGNGASDKGRITKYTVNAFQADVYLWLENYQKALEACDKIVMAPGNPFRLVDGNGAWFTTLYANGNSTEGVFELQFDVQQLNPFYNMLFLIPRYVASGRVMEEIYQIDFEDDTKADIRADRASVVAANNAIYKYIGLNRNERKTLDQSFTHWFVYRYADILLMKAEALNQLGRGQEALNIIDVIRTRAKALDGTKMEVQPTDKNGIVDYLLNERAREFAFEGKRWYDVLRNAKRNNYERLDLLIDMVTYSAPIDKQQSIISKYRDVNSHYLPIYYQELLTNKALVQNPFYQ